MKKKLMGILVCPVCKGQLKLTIDKEKAEEIIDGSLYCARCDGTYPIIDGIPHMLPPEERGK